MDNFADRALTFLGKTFILGAMTFFVLVILSGIGLFAVEIAHEVKRIWLQGI